MNENDYNVKKLAVVIPFYNSMRTLPKLIRSLKEADTSECEILFVDDGSTDESRAFIMENGFNVHCMPENAGPSAARNEGIRLTQSPLILFADSDVVVYSPDAFTRIIKTFEAFPNLNTVSTISLPTPENSSLLAKYTALNEYLVYDRYIQGRKEVENWPEISTRFGAYKRETLEAINGFDTRFPIASVEDADLFYRIQSIGHTGYLLAWIKIGHHWPSRLFPLVKAWVVRAFLWSQLFAKRKSFDQVFSTRREAILKALDCAAFGTILLLLPFPHLLPAGLALECIALLSKTPMFVQFYKYYGVLTALGALFISQLNSISLGIGVMAAVAHRLKKGATQE